jgi:hypothetical protein
LHPAGKATMTQIVPIVAFLETSIGPEGNQGIDLGTAAWACYSMALWNHRLSDPNQVIRWGELSLQHDMQHHVRNEERTVCVRLLIAMARHQLGKGEQARKLLADAAKPVRRMINPSSGIGSGNIMPWVDWMIADILLKEAEGVIGASGTN